MNKFTRIIILLCWHAIASLHISAQTGNAISHIVSKPPVDSGALHNWDKAIHPSSLKISGDGHYFLYNFENQPAESHTLFIQSTNAAWKKEFTGADDGFFTKDNKQVIFKQNDTLFVWSLGKDRKRYIPNVTFFKAPEAGMGEWIAYQLTNNDVVLLNLARNTEKHFDLVDDYAFDNNGTKLLLKRRIKKGNILNDRLEWIDLLTDKTHYIWSADTVKGCTMKLSAWQFDEPGKQLVFLVEENAGTGIIDSNNAIRPLYSIWYYNAGMPMAIQKISNETSGIEPGMIISSTTPYFDAEGNYIYFMVRSNQYLRKPDPANVQVDIWNYKDIVLQYSQMWEGNLYSPKLDFLAVQPVKGNGVLTLERNRNEEVYYFSESSAKADFVIIRQQSYKGDKYWLPKPTTYFLVSLQDGIRKKIDTGMISHFSCTPNGDYIVYYNLDSNSYFSYKINSGAVLNISRDIRVPLNDKIYDEITRKSSIASWPAGIAGWLEDGCLLIYDNYDIWKLDPSGIQAPKNITNYYGQSHNIKFKVVYEKTKDFKKFVVHPRNAPLLLTAFNTKTKDNGFYKVMMNNTGDPEMLTMGPYNYFTVEGRQTEGYGLSNMQPIKAETANAWIVQRQTAESSPNYFFTKDFKRFTALTDYQPQMGYNWLTAELVSWQQLDGTPCQGILYKPDNFDENKKYPIIFYFYEKMSQNFHLYLKPEFSEGAINIPWFVSHGYLVFTPDIHFKVGYTGESILNSVVSAARYMSKMPWVDSMRMGIQGHSFGGYGANYVITHTANLFAAAAEGAGPSNWISFYFAMRRSLLPQAATLFEYGGQIRADASLWENPDLYIANSPIFTLSKVTTPILIMHNKNDPTVPWEQGLSFFIGLRRNDKKVWMLQYDEGKHGVFGKDAIDYSIRLEQFFDHYLKGKLAPKWMTEGVPYNLKTIETGLELDPYGSCGKDCKICKEKKYNNQ